MTDRELMRVSPQDFVKAVKDKEDLRGMPMIMSVWPTADNAQPEPKPIAWYYAGNDVECASVALDADLDEKQKANCNPLYFAPPQREWQGLTDDELAELYWSNGASGFARAIEAKLKEKNSG